MMTLNTIAFGVVLFIGMYALTALLFRRARTHG
jgi:hypothetical protein